MERFVAAVSLVALMIGDEAQVHAAEAYPVLGVEIRNGDILAFEPGVIAVLGTPAKSSRPLIASLRGELAGGGAGVGVGLVIAATDKPDPDPRDLLFGGLALVEMRVERMYASTSWNHTIYAGPQLTFCAPVVPKVSLGWMVDLRDAADNHVQVGLGFGF